MKNIIAIVLILVSIGIYVWYVSPTYGRVEELRAEANRFDEALGKSRELIDVRDALLTEYNALSQEDLIRLEKLLPDTVDNVRLIIDIDNIAAERGLTLSDVRIDTASAIDTTDTEDFGPENDGATRGSLTLGFSIVSSYEDFIQFLMDIEESLRIVDVTQISFNASGVEPVNDYGVIIQTYWLR